jgi:WD40 repeat protein
MNRCWTLSLLACLTGLPAARAQQVKELPPCKGVKFNLNGVALSPDGKTVALSAGDSRGGELLFYELGTGKQVGTLPGPPSRPGPGGHYASLGFSPDGKTLYALASDGEVMALDVAGLAISRRFGKVQIPPMGLAIDNQGKRLAAWGFSDVIVWDTATGKTLLAIKRNRAQTYNHFAFSSDMTRLAFAHYDEFDLLEVPGQKCLATFGEHRGQIQHFAFRKDGKVLATASLRYDPERREYVGQVKLWDAIAGKEITTPPRPFGWIRQMAFSPGGQELIYLEDERTRRITWVYKVYRYDLRTHKAHLIHQIRPPTQFCEMLFHPDGRLLLFAREGDAVRIWQWAAGKD